MCFGENKIANKSDSATIQPGFSCWPLLFEGQVEQCHLLTVYNYSAIVQINDLVHGKL